MHKRRAVELSTEKMKTQFGLKPKPKFKVVNWIGLSERRVTPKLLPATEILDDGLPDF
jgi:hypothetical protein